MQAWIKTVDIESLEEGKQYFVAKRYGADSCGFGVYFLGRGLNRKLCWTVKPGIALQFDAERTSQIIDDERKRDPEKMFMVIEVPSDAHKRWRSRAAVLSGTRKTHPFQPPQPPKGAK